MSERRLRRIVEAIADGVPARTLKDELLALEARQDELRAELEAAPEPQQPLLHPRLPEVYRDKVAALHQALADETVQDEAFELIRSLIEKVVVRPTEGGMEIDLQGDLGGILSLCRQSKTPGRSRAHAEQIKGVAGACNLLRALFAVPGIEALRQCPAVHEALEPSRGTNPQTNPHDGRSLIDPRQFPRR